MTRLRGRLVLLIAPEAATAAAMLFVLTIVTEPLWRSVMTSIVGTGP